MLKLTVEAGPFSAFFTNVNTQMNLPGHSHYARIRLLFQVHGDATGFPSFAATHAVIQEKIIELFAKPLRNARNEDVVRLVFETFKDFTHPEIQKWGGDYYLKRATLEVRGVPDKIGHADSFTVYAVEDD